MQPGADLLRLVTGGILGGLIVYGIMDVGRSSARVQAMHMATSEMRQSLHALAENAELIDIYTRGKHDMSSLSSIEKSRAIAFVHGFFAASYSAYYAWQDGLLPDAYWTARQAELGHLLQTPLYCTYWSMRRDVFPLDFRAVMDGLLKADCAR